MRTFIPYKIALFILQIDFFDCLKTGNLIMNEFVSRIKASRDFYVIRNLPHKDNIKIFQAYS